MEERIGSLSDQAIRRWDDREENGRIHHFDRKADGAILFGLPQRQPSVGPFPGNAGFAYQFVNSLQQATGVGGSYQ